MQSFFDDTAPWQNADLALYAIETLWNRGSQVTLVTCIKTNQLQAFAHAVSASPAHKRETHTYLEYSAAEIQIMKSALIFLLSFAFSLEVVRAVGLTSRRMRTNTKSISECQTCEYIMKFVRFQTVSRGQSVEAIKEKIKALLKLTPSSAQVCQVFFAIF